MIVNENNLDRDPPNPGKFKFQIVAREKKGTAASAPVSLTVNLKDVNDNPPVVQVVTPISVPATDGKTKVTRIHASDNDEGNYKFIVTIALMKVIVLNIQWTYETCKNIIFEYYKCLFP